MNKSLLSVAAFATFMAGATLPSYADHASAVIQVAGYQGGDYQGGNYQNPYPGYHDDDDYYDDEDDQISCREGSQVVRESGFRRVQPLRCSGDIYRYRAFRRGKIWTVRVDSWSGRIVSARIIRTY